MLEKGFLKRIERFTRAQPLDCQDLASGGLIRQCAAGAYRQTIQQDGARPTDLNVAGSFHASQAKIVPQKVNQQPARFDSCCDRPAVYDRLKGKAFWLHVSFWGAYARMPRPPAAEPSA